MRVETYTITHNEEHRLPWYFECYAWADAHFVIDNGSTDRTQDIARANPKATLLHYESDGLDDDAMLRVKEHCWRESKADWVIVGDVDEHLTHPDIRMMLLNVMSLQDVVTLHNDDLSCTILLPAKAYTMMSRTEPKHYTEMMRGYEDEPYRKAICFRPDMVQSVNWNHGCHKADPKGERIIYGVPPQLYLMHYHYDGLERTLQRYKERAARMCERNRQNGWGKQYLLDPAEIRERFDNYETLEEVAPWWLRQRASGSKRT